MSGVMSKCLQCTKTFITQAALNIHVKVHHDFEVEVYEEMLLEDLADNTEQNEKDVFSLDWLPEWKAYQSTKTVSIRLPEVGGSSTHVCEQRAHGQSRQRGSELDILSCLICKAPFTCEEVLSIHMRMAHQQILAYQCSLCCTKLKTVEGVKSHFYYIHGKVLQTQKMMISNVSVGYLGNGAKKGNNLPKPHRHSQKEKKSFFYKAPMPIKRKLTYKGWKKQKRIRIKTSLHKHQRIITGVQPFRCWWPGCNRKFANRKVLRHHFKTHLKSPNRNDATEHQQQIIDDIAVQNDPQQGTIYKETIVVIPESGKEDAQQTQNVGEMSVASPLNLEPDSPKPHASIFKQSTNSRSTPTCHIQRDKTVIVSRGGLYQTARDGKVGKLQAQNHLISSCETVVESDTGNPSRLMKNSSVYDNWLGNGGSVISIQEESRNSPIGKKTILHNRSLHERASPNISILTVESGASQVSLEAELNSEVGAPVEGVRNHSESQEPPLVTLNSESESEVEQQPQAKFWKCVVCQAPFSFGFQLDHHIKAEHGLQPVFNYFCNPCGIEFSSSNEFKSHMFEFHQKVFKTPEEELQELFLQSVGTLQQFIQQQSREILNDPDALLAASTPSVPVPEPSPSSLLQCGKNVHPDSSQLEAHQLEQSPDKPRQIGWEDCISSFSK